MNDTIAEVMESEIETLDGKETFIGSVVRAFLWAVVFGELLLIVGVRS